jgi:hypothetical protein
LPERFWCQHFLVPALFWCSYICRPKFRDLGTHSTATTVTWC